MAAKFLCCLPLRLGVFIFTLAQFLLCGASAALLWFILFSTRTNEQWHALAEYTRITVIVVAAVYSFTALVGLLGLLGAMFKKNALVKTYYFVLWISWLGQIGSGLWFIVMFFRARARGASNDCDNLSEEICDGLKALRNVHPAAVITPLAASVLITAYVIYITHFYIRRIADQKAEKMYGAARPNSQYHYVPVQQKTEGAQANYLYTNGVNAFGSNSLNRPGPAAKTAYDPVPVPGVPKDTV